MSQNQVFVIVGAGLAGAKAAETLREEGFDGRIILVGAESERPYIRPPLSKEYLNGSAERESIFVHPDSWYGEHSVELRLGDAAVGVDLEAHEVELASGDRLRYDKLLLSTGAASRRLGGAGDTFTGVHYLRTVGESERLRAELASGDKRVVMVGSGWIGLEVAAAARQYGNPVTVLDLDPVPLKAALGEELGAVFGALHREHGVELRMPVRVRELAGSAGAVTGVVLEDGETIPADLVVVSIGAVPNVELATGAGLDVQNGITVDESLQTSDADVYAAGDGASAFHPVLSDHLRVEHWANAQDQGVAVAKAMLGQQVSYDTIPYFYTDQYDLGMEYSGYGILAKDATVAYRGDPATREFIAFWLKDGRVVAGMNVNVWDVNETVQKLIRSGVRVDPEKLADRSISLDDLANPSSDS